jgi:hypothetical protein
VRYPAAGSGTPEIPNWCYGPAADAVTQTQNMADLITNLTTNTSAPGFATPRKAVTIHCIAFGSLFSTSNTSPAQTQALNLLQYMQYKGGTQSDATTALAPAKIINQSVWDDGTNDPTTSRKAAMKQAFSMCMQDTVNVVLIR